MKCSLWTIVFVAMLAPVGLGQAVESRGTFQERYGVLIEGNIFLRQRSSGRSAPTTAPSTRPAAAPLSPEQSLVLTGIVLEEGEFRAYFENLRDPAIVRVAAGEALARGQVTDIAIDAVAFESNGQVTWVEIGRDLTGAVPSLAERVTTIPATPVPPASGASSGSAPPGGASSIAEQMRQRRLQELNRGQ